MMEAGLTALKQLLAGPEPAGLGPARRVVTLSAAELTRAFEFMLPRVRLAPPNDALIRALILLWHDHLDAWHHISQGVENTDGNFVHALLHRREPDAWNSKYWWRRVGAHRTFPAIARRVDELLRARGAGGLAKRLLPGGNWDANAFVDACTAGLARPDSDPHLKLLREIQRIETEVLFDQLLAAAAP